MSDTGRLAVFHGTGKPFEIREYPVPEPEPGAILVRIALANVCGSDMHYWRGEQDYVKMGRPLPLNTGHEHVGTVARLGPGVTADSAGQPLAVGDRVLYRYFFPCGHCKACLRRQYKSCPVRQANWLVNLVQRVVEVHRGPAPDTSARYGWRYALVHTVVPPDPVSPLAVPGALIPSTDLLP